MLTPEELAALPQDPVERTRAVLQRALKTASFDPPGALPAYVGPDGRRCLVGEALSLLGVSDDDLRGTGMDNTTSFYGRPDLVAWAEKLGLQPGLLSVAQEAADRLVMTTMIGGPRYA